MSFLDVEEHAYDASLPPIDTRGLAHRIAASPRRKRAVVFDYKRATGDRLCHYCTIDGSVGSDDGPTSPVALQPLEGLENKYECVDERRCENRIRRSLRNSA